VLGPTLFGLLAPHVYPLLFPPASLPYLNSLNSLGICLMVYLVGVRFDFDILKTHRQTALVTSPMSIMAPMLMGILLAQYLFPTYGKGDRITFSLFVGVAMSVTAFPVLVRILTDLDLIATRLGSLALACAAVDDLTAWILLAVILAMTKHNQNARPLWVMAISLAIFAVALLSLHRILDHWSRSLESSSRPSHHVLVALLLSLLCGAAGAWVGIHSLVAAFAAGLITPRKLASQLFAALEPFTVLVLMPLFFALTGIRTNFNVAGGGRSFLDLSLVLLVAVLGKWGGTMIGTLATGMSWFEGCQLGIMVNTRGLVELVILSVGLDSGILSKEMFSMMVCMTLITTFMATPLIYWMDTFKRKPLVMQ